MRSRGGVNFRDQSGTQRNFNDGKDSLKIRYGNKMIGLFRS